MKPVEIFSGLGTLAGWVILNIALITMALFLRMDLEPGYSGPDEMFLAAIGLTCLGGLLFIAGNILLLVKQGYKALAITWLLIVVVGLCFCAISPLWLILMV
jgi:hypothetical protein